MTFATIAVDTVIQEIGFATSVMPNMSMFSTGQKKHQFSAENAPHFYQGDGTAQCVPGGMKTATVLGANVDLIQKLK